MEGSSGFFFDTYPFICNKKERNEFIIKEKKPG